MCGRQQSQIVGTLGVALLHSLERSPWDHVTFVALILNLSLHWDRDFESLVPLLPLLGEGAGG